MVVEVTLGVEGVLFPCLFKSVFSSVSIGSSFFTSPSPEVIYNLSFCVGG